MMQRAMLGCMFWILLMAVYAFISVAFMDTRYGRDCERALPVVTIVAFVLGQVIAFIEA